MSIKSNWSNVAFKANIYLFIFYLDDLSIEVSGVLKSPGHLFLTVVGPRQVY